MYLLVGDKWNTRTLLVVSECLKDRGFHNRTVHVNSLDPNGIVWRQGKPQFHKVSRVVSWFVYKGWCSHITDHIRTMTRYESVSSPCKDTERKVHGFSVEAGTGVGER